MCNVLAFICSNGSKVVFLCIFLSLFSYLPEFLEMGKKERNAHFRRADKQEQLRIFELERKNNPERYASVGGRICVQCHHTNDINAIAAQLQLSMALL